MVEKVVTLKPGREKSVLARHPWIFGSAVEKVDGEPLNGEVVTVRDHYKKEICQAAYSHQSQIKCRVWTWDPTEKVDGDFLHKRISASIERRKTLLNMEKTDALRLVFGEADGLPGLVVDQYGTVLVMQILAAGAEYFRKEILSILVELLKPTAVYERSDVEVRLLEGLIERSGIVYGQVTSNEIIITENGIHYVVDVLAGQKTGFYIDQRRNRQKVFDLAAGLEVLNCFCYTGGFTLNALAGGAKKVTSVDSSGEALAQLQRNLVLNGLDENKSEIIEGDVFKLLRLFRDQARSFDMIVLDPPKFAPTVSQAEKATRAYKDINLLAIKLLRPGGTLVTFSCSGGISRELFQKIVAGAAQDAGVEIRIVDTLSQSPDHPVLLSFPESFYLKGLICKK